MLADDQLLFTQCVILDKTHFDIQKLNMQRRYEYVSVVLVERYDWQKLVNINQFSGIFFLSIGEALIPSLEIGESRDIVRNIVHCCLYYCEQQAKSRLSYRMSREASSAAYISDIILSPYHFLQGKLIILISLRRRYSR